MLRLDRLARERLADDPYPHIVFDDALDRMDDLNAAFPSKDRFGPTIRMDGDLTEGDQEYQELMMQSPAYRALHRQVYSAEFIQAFLELFRSPIERAYKNGELLADPFSLRIVPEPVENRVGRFFVEATDAFLYPRFDIG